MTRRPERAAASGAPDDGDRASLRAVLARLLGAERIDVLRVGATGDLAPDPVAGDGHDPVAASVVESDRTVIRHGEPVLEGTNAATGLWWPIRRDGGVGGVVRVVWSRRLDPSADILTVVEGAAELLAGLWDRQSLVAELEQWRRQRRITLEVAAGLAAELDVEVLAQRIVEGVTAVTDFSVATLTVRDGDACRRVAAAGMEDRRIGLATEYARWQELLREEFRTREISFLLPPEASDAPWVQTVQVPQATVIDRRRGRWTKEHGLVIELLDDEHERVGFLSVDAPRSGLLPDDPELEQLELFARQAQTGLRNAWLHEELRRGRDTAEALREVTTSVSSTPDLEGTLERCCRTVVERSVGERATAYLFDPRERTIRSVMVAGESPPGAGSIPPALLGAVPAFAEALATRRPVLVEEVTSEHVPPAVLAASGVKSMAVYPLVAVDEPLGVLVAETFQEHVTFPLDEVDVMEQVAAQASLAIQRAQLHKAVYSEAARAAEFYELTKELTRTLDFDTLFARISEAVRSRTPARVVDLLERHGDTLQRLRTNVASASLPYDGVPVSALPTELWQSLCSDGIACIDDLRRIAADDHARSGIRSVLVAGHAEQEGEPPRLLLSVSSWEVSAFGASDTVFVQGLVEIAALALRNARLYEEATTAAERDALTGLRNRRAYSAEVPGTLETATADAPVALAVVDVDDFKSVNDRHGHDGGDEVLVHVADRLRRSVRETDAIYRLGGEEFAVVMPGTTLEQARHVAERIRFTVAVSRRDLPPVTVSVGLAAAPAQGDTLDQLFRAADGALYAAKEAGKDVVHVAGASTGGA